VIKKASTFLNRFNGLQEHRKPFETVGQFMITARGHRAEATVLMRTLRVDPRSDALRNASPRESDDVDDINETGGQIAHPKNRKLPEPPDTFRTGCSYALNLARNSIKVCAVCHSFPYSFNYKRN
jgi:hypothetical protein